MRRISETGLRYRTATMPDPEPYIYIYIYIYSTEQVQSDRSQHNRTYHNVLHRESPVDCVRLRIGYSSWWIGETRPKRDDRDQQWDLCILRRRVFSHITLPVNMFIVRNWLRWILIVNLNLLNVILNVSMVSYSLLWRSYKLALCH